MAAEREKKGRLLEAFHKDTDGTCQLIGHGN